MNAVFIFGAIVAVAMGHPTSDVNRPVVKFSDVEEGNVNAVRLALTGHMRPHQLDKFLNIIRDWGNESTIYESFVAMKVFNAIALAAKSNTSETDWIKFMSGDLSMLTDDELTFTKRWGDPRYAKWRTTKGVFKFRTNANDAELMTTYVAGMQLQNKKLQLFAMKQMLIIVLSALSDQPESETREWVRMDDENSEWYKKNMSNAYNVLN